MQVSTTGDRLLSVVARSSTLNTGNITPSREWGAFEFALRYSSIDLNDGTIPGSQEHGWTLGANWYLGRHLRIQANCIHA